MNISSIQSDFKKLADPVRAQHSQRFFKTGKGEYGEGDIFLGIKVPEVRNLVRKHKGVSLDIILHFLKSKFHEERLFAILSMVLCFEKGDAEKRRQLYDLYLKNTRFINNWDLVDLSSSQIVGAYLEKKERKVLYKLAESGDLWKRRIAIIATFRFIRRLDFEDTLKLATLLRNDQEDLIHKAVGWMLREVGNRDMKTEEDFLKKYYRELPRTMLRYAIEKFPEDKRQAYLKGKI